MLCSICNTDEAEEGCGFDNDLCSECNKLLEYCDYDTDKIRRVKAFLKTHEKACDDPTCNVWYEKGDKCTPVTKLNL